MGRGEKRLTRALEGEERVNQGIGGYRVGREEKMRRWGELAKACIKTLTFSPLCLHTIIYDFSDIIPEGHLTNIALPW